MLIPMYFLALSLIIFPANSFETCSRNEVHALILARGGSKGLKAKNLYKVEGVSLLGRTISTIKSTKLFRSIWVSTDNFQIANEASLYGAIVHQRPEAYALDATTSLESVQEFLRMHGTINRFALFQCTSIFLRDDYIHEAYEKFMNRNCVFAVTRSHNLRWSKLNGSMLPLNFDAKRRPRRQDWDGEYIETGMFYFSTRSLISELHFQDKSCQVVEVHREDALEIDTLDDVRLALCLMQSRPCTYASK